MKVGGQGGKTVFAQERQNSKVQTLNTAPPGPGGHNRYNDDDRPTATEIRIAYRQ